MKIEEIEQLLKRFNRLPKMVKEPTYLEICKYPKSRFEEICSRLLCFYLNPKGEHGFGDLFLKSLIEIIGKSDSIHVNYDTINIINEENAEGKRLDILIHDNNNFVIGIENKITANLYNPLEQYKNRVKLYSKENITLIVLSMNKITDKNELNLIKTLGFINITYAEYFDNIKQKIGYYINNCNNKYLTFVNDFIQTIENMKNLNLPNNQLNSFFSEKYEDIENLLYFFNQYKNDIWNIQIDRIDDLRMRIIEETNDDEWETWENWGLLCKFNSNKFTIGIESYFESTKNNPLGNFTILITTWDLKAWKYYEEKILQGFPKCDVKIENNRAKLVVEVIVDNDEELIISSLKRYYDFLLALGLPAGEGVCLNSPLVQHII